jgi:hypothetical protein
MPLSDRDWPQEPKSGRLLLRMPSSLHADVARAAAAEDVSLNLYICSTLARAVEWQPREQSARQRRKLHGDIGWDLWFERHGVDRREDTPDDDW